MEAPLQGPLHVIEFEKKCSSKINIGDEMKRIISTKNQRIIVRSIFKLEIRGQKVKKYSMDNEEIPFVFPYQRRIYFGPRLICIRILMLMEYLIV